YRLQAVWFGQGSDPGTLAKKILVDMGVYCPVWAVPSAVFAYAWAEKGFSLTRTLAPIRRLGFRGWFGRDVLPVMISNWSVWVPAVCVIYCLPLALQLPVQNLVLCFWSLLLVLQVGDSRERLAAGR
ncbi:MAG: Mpv17/PMP22 family protein, partial [Planctomycetota bacterium]